MNGVEDEDHATVHHVPFVPCEIIDGIWDKAVSADTDGVEQGLMPEVSTTHNRCKGVDDAKSQNAFDWT